MQITDIEVIPVQAPGRTLVPVLVHTDAGITGVGEAGLQRRWKAIEGAVEHMKRWLIGEDPMRIDHLWQRMFRGGFYPADRLIGSAISGIDIALWDIKGKALGAPIYQLLGGRCRDYVQCFLTPGYSPAISAETTDCFKFMTAGLDEPSAVAEQAKWCLAQGHKFFRLGPPSDGDLFEPRVGVRRLLDNLRAAREAVGSGLELMIDAHGRLNLPEAMMFCQAAEDLQLYLAEDLLHSEHPEGYRQLRAHTGIPLAAGEQWANKWEFRQAIEEELVDYVRIDICIAGGLTEAKKIAAMAETHFIQTLCHNPLGPINTAAALHLDLACPNAGPQEVIYPPVTMLPDVFQCAFALEGDRLTVPDAPGLGITFNRDAAREHPAEMTEPPHFHRADGTYTNY